MVVMRRLLGGMVAMRAVVLFFGVWWKSMPCVGMSRTKSMLFKSHAGLSVLMVAGCWETRPFFADL